MIMAARLSTRLCSAWRNFKVPHTSRRFISYEVRPHSVYVPTLSAEFPYIWLRDSCQCPLCVHPSTRQKLHRSSDVSHDIRPVDIQPLHPESKDNHSKQDGIYIEWSAGAQADNSTHQSFYSSAFFERYASSKSLTTFHRDVTVLPWSTKDISELIQSQQISVPYTSLSQDSSLLDASQHLLRYGLLFVRGVPNTETSDERCELRNLASKFGVIRKTFYGETWDVRNVRNSKNIAYTNLDLGLHMDLLYFQQPPRYQILHCLRNRVSGGHSIFVDALKVAVDLSRLERPNFDLLAAHDVEFHYVNDGHHLHCAHKTFELRTPSINTSQSSAMANMNITPEMIQSINYSPPFQAPLNPSTPLAVYGALRKFADLLNSTENRFEYLLREGDAVIFDNRRILHGRTTFTNDLDSPAEGETNRWLKGCYLQEDAVLDKMRVLDAHVRGANGD